MKINSKTKQKTHAGGYSKKISSIDELKRTVMACLLWENTFYESGESVSDRILKISEKCSMEELSKVAIDARTVFKLRHAPLLILIAMIKRGGKIVSKTIEEVINRPDELSELVSIYFKDGKKPLSSQMKKGLSLAFLKFNEYQFAKYNRDYDVKIRDVMFLCHAKPTKDKEELYKKIANNTLDNPNTWESRLAGGQDKKQVFTDLLEKNNLGYMALLRNLRGMDEVGVCENLIKKSILKPSAAPLPYRFIAASKNAPKFERELDSAMIKMLDSKDKFEGKTILLVDVSWSMCEPLSSKSDLKRIDAANGLAILLSSVCQDLQVFTFSNDIVEVAPRKGMALGDAIWNSQRNSGTKLGKAVKSILNIDHDRLVVITDEQSSDNVPNPTSKKSYVLNVASYKNGVGYGPWIHIDGFSESCIDFIKEYEKSNNK